MGLKLLSCSGVSGALLMRGSPARDATTMAPARVALQSIGHGWKKRFSIRLLCTKTGDDSVDKPVVSAVSPRQARPGRERLLFAQTSRNKPILISPPTRARSGTGADRTPAGDSRA